MNTEELPPNPVAEPLIPQPTTVSPGTLIREARQATGISVDDLATLIKLARPTVEAMERDDFSALLEPVYARGYYRKCAKVLNIDEKLLIDGYNQRVVPKSPLPPAKLRLASGNDLGSGSSLPVPTAIVVAVVAVLACALLWFLRGVGSTPKPVPTTSSIQSAATVIDSQPSASPSTPVPAPSADVQSGDAGTAAVAPSAASSGAPAVAETAVPPPAASAAAATATTSPAPTTSAAVSAPESSPPLGVSGNGPLLLKFSGKSWVRIKDADGTILVRNELTAGTQRRFSGKLPLDVFIGDAAMVTLEYNGQAIDLAPYTRTNKTAWLQLPLKTTP